MVVSLRRRLIVHFHLECIIARPHPRTRNSGIIPSITASAQILSGLQATLQRVVLSSLWRNVPVGWWVVVWVAELTVVARVIVLTASVVVRISIRTMREARMITRVATIILSIWKWMSRMNLVIKQRIRRR